MWVPRCGSTVQSSHGGGKTTSRASGSRRASRSGELRVYFERLDAVAPSEIADDLDTIVDAYEAADESLGGGLFAALGAMPALERINDYAVANCGRGV